MRTIAFVTQKGGSGKSTLALGLAGAALECGERVAILDTDPQGTIANWASRRNRPNPQVIPIGFTTELERALRRIAQTDRTLAIIDTAAGADSTVTATAMRSSDLCLLPSRPSIADIEASHATVRVLQRWGKPFAFALNQAPARYDVQEADPLHRLGVLAAPCIVLRNDHQHAIAAGLTACEWAPTSKAAQELRGLWTWTRQRLDCAAAA